MLYIGPVDVPGKNELFGRARALLHLNTIPERFGLVLTEANAAGVPVIAMNLGSCRELTTSLKQFGPSDEFLKSMVVPVAIVSSNTFRSIPWWRDTNGFTR
jgi:glycosyltransferase involved in cell wall biosynthesis